MTTEPEMVAGHGSRCRLCKKWIRAGEYIARIPGGAWVHALCAHQLRRTREEEDPSTNEEVEASHASDKWL